MGVDYESPNITQCCDQYESFFPFFNFSQTEENKEKKTKKSERTKKFSKIKNSNSSKIISRSNRSTTDTDEKEYLKNNLKKEDTFKKIFTDSNNSGFFAQKKENDLKNKDEKYNLRKNYYSKLIYKNVWSPGIKQKTHNTLFIFDWDDTLFPTSFLVKEEIVDVFPLSKNLKDLFALLEEILIKILRFSKTRGDVYIISNSNMSWLTYSLEKYLPILKKFLDEINIISSRDRYEEVFPGDFKIWKERTFLDLTRNINDKLVTNILCFGDSKIDIDAGKILAQQFNNSFIKTIKFKENPDMEDLIGQLKLVSEKIEFIYSKGKNLSITIEDKII